jgi:hypothetical protein
MALGEIMRDSITEKHGNPINGCGKCKTLELQPQETVSMTNK